MKKDKLLHVLYRTYNRIGLSTPPTGSLLYHFNEKLRGFGNRDLALTAKVIDKNEIKPFRIFILDGIGDALWSLTLLPAVMELFMVDKAEFVLPEIDSIRKRRSEEFLRRFSFVSDVTYAKTSIHKANAWDPEGGLNYSYSIGPNLRENVPFDYSLVVNPFLERGLGYEEIAQLHGLDPARIRKNPMDQFPELNEDRKIYDLFLSNLEFCIVYIGSEADNSVTGLNRQGLFAINDWVKVLEEISNRGIHIVLVGAAYDISYSHKVIRNLANKTKIINLMGMTSLPELIYIQRRAQFTIGLASGVTIMAPFLNTDAAIFFRDESFPMSQYFSYSRFLKDFATDWIPMTYSGKYIPLFYGADNWETVVAKLIGKGVLS
jgi:hypothetical protein